MILRDPGRKQTMEGSLEGVGALGGLVLLVLVVLTILLPVSVYSAQKYAYKCYIQLKRVNSELKGVTSELKGVTSELKGVSSQLNTVNESMTLLAEVEAKRLRAGRAREAGQ